MSKALAGLGDEFKPDTLSYLLMTSKEERLLCGALAKRLHETFARGSYVVRREWPVPTSQGRPPAIDIAILGRGSPIALIEATAAMSFNLAKSGRNPFPIRKVQSDIDKLRSIQTESKRFILTFFAHARQMPDRAYDTAMPYSDDMRRYGVVGQGTIDSGLERIREAVGNLPVVAQGEVRSGRAFGVDVSVLYLLMRVTR